MVGNPRSELASSITEGSSLTAAFCNGQRGSYSGASLERSGSFRESIDSRVLSSGAGGNRTTSPVTAAEIPSPSQFLILDFLSLGDQKYSRAGELRRVIGVSPEDHSFGIVQSKPLTPAAAEELKRFKASVSETTSKARDRTRLLQESITKLDRYRGLISRKRQRSDISSSEKSGSANLMKMGSQIHQNPSDLAAQRLEERSKSTVPNKRMRTSVAEVRAEGRGTVPLRQGPPVDKEKNTLVDKDKNMLRACNGSLMPVEDKIRVLPGGEGWDKKMKRKRSVGPLVARPIDGDRDFKSSSQQRLNIESRARPSDGLSFRQGSSGVTGTNKTESSSQPNVPGNRTFRWLDKERGIAKGGNKQSVRPKPFDKRKGISGPRTGSSAIMNSSSNFQRTPVGIDGWDQTSCLSKVQCGSGANNRKNSLPAVSTSSPVTQWGNQRLSKNTRTRRTNLVSPVQNHDEPMILAEGVSSDVGGRAVAEATGITLSRSLSNTQQIKIKLDSVLSPSTVSESEESIAVENKYKDKGGHTSEMEDGVVSALQKVTTSMLPAKKNRPPREETGEGVRRPGRSGRGSSQFKGGAHLSKEKMESVDASRPLRIGRPSSDISKVGRPPSKKMSERKSYGRPALVINNGSSELTGEPDDDHNELLLAADSARKASSQSCSSSFWTKIEQIKFLEDVDGGCSVMADADCNTIGERGAHQPLSSTQTLSNPEGMDNTKRIVSGKFEPDRWLQNIFPLSQRLLAAFIEEDENGTIDYGTRREDSMQFASDYACHVTTGHGSFEAKNADKIVSEYESELSFLTRKNGSRDSSCNGYSGSSNFRSPDSQPFSYSDEPLQENNIHGARSEYGQDSIGRASVMGSDMSCSTFECQYSQRRLDDKILMELQNIGLLLDMVPGLDEGEDDELDRDLSTLKGKLYEQMKIKKARLYQLDKAVQNAREVNERKLEKIAMDKLVEMAYKKYLGIVETGLTAYHLHLYDDLKPVENGMPIFWGRGSHKSGANKISKQAALSFAKRVLERCRKFEDTGFSCFREPSLRDALFSVSPYDAAEAKSVDGVLPAVGSNTYAEARSSQLGARLGASGVLTNTAADTSGAMGHKVEPDLSKGLASLSEQGFAKQEANTSRGKKREVLLDDVAGVTTASRAASASASGKRSERERDQNSLMRNPKAGRPSVSGFRGERKTKMKPRQKTAQLSSASGTGLLGRLSEAPSPAAPLRESCEAASNGNETLPRHGSGHGFPNLSLESIDGLDVGADLGGQGQDIGSWLSVDDEALQDNDLMMGLEIPMDDLSEINMNF
ncbi:unnamed protein product [Spirodela intermedia]|uniref:Uncharacterized protein n=1 Tax=Spirodela intermedia TaxID=51605 RepID=A0A7I8JFK5_SPIIN|nr:unnamed protein product [Spirodela intermedia]CAA6668505.1 unnamed protein product [Spirodela intermedia]